MTKVNLGNWINIIFIMMTDIIFLESFCMYIVKVLSILRSEGNVVYDKSQLCLWYFDKLTFPLCNMFVILKPF